MQDPVYPGFRYSTNKVDVRNSFAALLYGPPSLLQGDYHELSDRKLCTSSGICTAASGNLVDSVESEAFPTSSCGIITENLNNRNLQSWPVTVPDISPRSMVDLSSSSCSVLHGIQSSNTAAEPRLTGCEKEREPFSSRNQWCGASPASRLDVCSSDIQTTPNMVLEQCSTKHTSLFMSGCPRVFCMGKSGYLLLSNTGLLGIVCLCHSCHMSVHKFCEHSGSHGINPGDAVRMESGETIAQWQKLYFLKFGIRSLGDQSEWDWPEILSTTGSLIKSNASASNMSRSDLSHISCSPAVILRSAKPSDYIMFPKNAHTNPSLFPGALYTRKQLTTIQEGSNILPKGFAGISQNNLYDRVKRQIKDSNLTTPSTAPSFVGTQLDDGCEPVLPFLDSLQRNGNLSVAHSPSQTPPFFLKDQECIKNNDAIDVLVGKDAASNIELRLGQPPQLGNPVPSNIEPPLFDALASPPKLHPLQQMINMPSGEEELLNNFCYATGSFKMDKELLQLKHRNYISGVSNSLGGAENLAKGSSFSSFPQLNIHPEGKTIASEILVNDSRPIMSKKQHSKFSTMQFGPTHGLWNSNDHIRKQLNCSATDSIKSLDNYKGVSFAKRSCAKLNSGFGISNLVEYPSSVTGAVGDRDSCISPANEKICESYNESSFPSVTSAGSTSGMAIPYERILKGFPFLVSSSTSDQTPTFLQKHGINMDTSLLDENMRLHALHFREMNQKQGRSSDISEVQPHEYETSTSEQFTSGATLKLPQNRGTGGNSDTTDDIEKQASLTGLNRYSHSSLAPIPLHSMEKESQCKHAYDIRNERPSLRFSGVVPSCYTFKQKFANTSGETSLSIASKFGRDQNVSKDESIPFEQGGKLDGQNSAKIGSPNTHQWRDVPSKVRKADCDATPLGPSPTILDREGHDGVQRVNTSAKRFRRTINVGDLLKEQYNFNVSSGCSAHVVTEASLEFNKVDSCAIDAVDTGYVNDAVVEKGSGIDKGWSPDAVESGSGVFLGSTRESYLNKGCLRVLNNQPCHSLLNELKLLDSLTWKKARDQTHIMHSGNCKASPSQKVKKDFKGKKRKRNKVRMLDASLSFRTPSLLHNKNGECTSKASFFHPCTKQKHTTFTSKFVACENYQSKHHSDKEDSYVSGSNSDAEFHSFTEVSGRKKLRTDFASDCFRHFQLQDPACEEPESVKLKSLSSRKTNANRIIKPVVFGEFGEICNGKLAGEVPKPAKIVSLSKVLKASKRCTVPTNGKLRLTSKKKWKRMSCGTSSEDCCGQPAINTKEGSDNQNTTICNEKNADVSIEDLEKGNKPHVLYKGKRDIKAKQGGSTVNRAATQLKLKSREIRKQRSIYELTAKETKVKDTLKHDEDTEHGLCNTKSRNFVQEHMSISILNSDAFCSVCRNSSNDDINCLLECSRCLIRVHQACYGISTIPKKGRWCCRPCRTNSKDIACVLCGYGGGAMTGAILSRTIVKSLLKVWRFEKDAMPKHTASHEVLDKEINAFGSSNSGLELDQTSALSPQNVDTSRSDLLKVEMSTNHMQHTPYSVSNFKVHNSITAGVLDTSVKQWVHMVCGLWTPRTRCPNVDTMSAFDVSGVMRPGADMVCSICNRQGGSCIECRIVDCFVMFHPWCAHQKNLLQCETEGADDEKVGFYGTCMLHAIDPRYQSKYDPIDDMGSLEEKEFSCARTEGYNGRKRDGFYNNHYGALKAKGGCLVPEEQLNAWIHINGQKLCSQGLPKAASDVEHDCRKEYARYKQAKCWKHLVVYKSGIHGLGLYTSRSISRGEMVVEYVGEIVGPRVADKREIEYQSGRKLQYKSACYFFRIDKEHIIDATRKGGIARFVNHSCLPNCVAKVITIRHEKKVVFFAVRDIYPGEEITYDYHFNNEDEGKKIPCYCNSKNCRRYLN